MIHPVHQHLLQDPINLQCSRLHITNRANPFSTTIHQSRRSQNGVEPSPTTTLQQLNLRSSLLPLACLSLHHLAHPRVREAHFFTEPIISEISLRHARIEAPVTSDALLTGDVFFFKVHVVAVRTFDEGWHRGRVERRDGAVGFVVPGVIKKGFFVAEDVS